MSEEGGAAKRRKVSFAEVTEDLQLLKELEDGEEPPPPEVQPDTSGQGLPTAGPEVEAAMRRISAHLSKAPKFCKAAGLLRQLLESHTLLPSHGPPLLEALRQALREPRRVKDPTYRREYRKLLEAVTPHEHIFDPARRRQLDVYRVWVGRVCAIFTDDSFAFTKATAALKSLVADLPAEAEADDSVRAAAMEKHKRDAVSSTASKSGRMEPPEAAEADPFGLEALIDPESTQETAAAVGVVWSEEEASCMLREALLDAVDAARSLYSSPLTGWSRAPWHALIDAVQAARSRFSPAQRERIAEMWGFVTAARAGARQGPSQLEKARDGTEFERASQRMRDADNISSRGKVTGNSTDGVSAHWLG